MYKILVAVDGSTFARHAAEFAADLCTRISDAQATAIYVKDFSYPYLTFAAQPGISVMPDMPVIEEELEKSANTALAAAQEVFGQKGKTVELRSAWGRPAEIICDLAEKEHFDLIVTGSRGMGHFAGILLGSVSDRVAHRATVPVVIVRK